MDGETQIRHVLTTSYQPASNGLTEKAFQIFKNAMKVTIRGTVQSCVQHFLF